MQQARILRALMNSDIVRRKFDIRDLYSPRCVKTKRSKCENSQTVPGGEGSITMTKGYLSERSIIRTYGPE